MNPPGPHPHPPGADAANPAAARRRAAALAGHVGDLDTARAHLADPDPGVRATALGAFLRAGGPVADVLTLTTDPDPGVRRRLAEELGRRVAGADRADEEHTGAPAPDEADGPVVDVLRRLVADEDPLTCEAAAWSLGEVASSHTGDAPHLRATTVPVLIDAAGHDDALVREAAVAALGAIGDPAGLATVLQATTDRPAIRRRAVLALAAFLGEPGVDEALERATADRDWQVRQAAELLRRPDP
jgi:HEAT repeat protein